MVSVIHLKGAKGLNGNSSIFNWMHSFCAPQLQMYITLEWPHLWLLSWVCVNGWTLLLCLQILWQGVWKKGVSYHKPLNWHLVGPVFLWSCKQLCIQGTIHKRHQYTHFMTGENIFSSAKMFWKEKTHDFIIVYYIFKNRCSPNKVLGRESTADTCFMTFTVLTK